MLNALNFSAIIVAAIVAYVIGMLWFTVLFGKTWRRLMGIQEGVKPPQNEMIRSMVGGFIVTLVLCFVLALFVGALGVASIYGAVILSLWIWIGFIATVMSNMIWYEKKPWKLYAINVFHYLVVIIAAALVLALW